MSTATAPRTRTYGLLAAGMVVFGSGTPVSKVVTGAFPVAVASGARMALAAALLTAMLAATGRLGELREIPRAQWPRIVAIALFGMVLFSVFLLYGMKEISGAVGGIVMATTPAITAAGSVLFLRDRVDRWKALAIGCAVGGVLAVNLSSGAGGGGGGSVALGTLLVLGAVCGEAAYTLLGKRVMEDVDPLPVAAAAALLAAVLFAPWAVVQAVGFDWAQAAATDWLALAWWGAGTMALGSVLWYRAVEDAAGTTASAFMGLMPVSALVLSYVLLGEAFEWMHAVGMVAVLAGIAAVTRSHKDGDPHA